MKQEPGRQPPGIPALQGGEDVNTTNNPSEAAVSNAYEVAKAGGKHAGYLKQYAALPDHLVEKADGVFRPTHSC